MLTIPTLQSTIRCSKCGEPSDLRIVIPSVDKPGYDERSFQCKSCGYADTLFVKVKGLAAQG